MPSSSWARRVPKNRTSGRCCGVSLMGGGCGQWAATHGLASRCMCRSLQDMLRAHTLVKVQLNAQPLGIAELAPQLAAQSEATLVAVRGRTILLAQGRLPLWSSNLHTLALH